MPPAAPAEGWEELYPHKQRASQGTGGARPVASLFRQLVDDPACAVDFPGDEERESDVGRDRPAGLLVIAPIARHGLFVSIEEQPNDTEVSVENRAPRASAGGVVRGDEVHREARVLRPEPLVPHELPPPAKRIRQSVVALIALFLGEAEEPPEPRGG